MRWKPKQRVFVRMVVVSSLVTVALVLVSSGDAAALYHFARLHVSPELVLRYMDAPAESPSARACELFVDTATGRRALLERVFESLAASELHEAFGAARCGVLAFDGERLIAKAYRNGYGTVGLRERSTEDNERLYRWLADHIPSWCGKTIAVDAIPLRVEVLSVDDALLRYADITGQEIRGNPGPLWPCDVCLFWEGNSAR